MSACAHENRKQLGAHAWCRDCGSLRALEEGARWVRPGRAWRTGRRTTTKRPASKQLDWIRDDETRS